MISTQQGDSLNPGSSAWQIGSSKTAAKPLRSNSTFSGPCPPHANAAKRVSTLRAAASSMRGATARDIMHDGLYSTTTHATVLSWGRTRDAPFSSTSTSSGDSSNTSCDVPKRRSAFSASSRNLCGNQISSGPPASMLSP